MNKLLFVLAALMVGGAILGGIWVAGGPEHARMQKRDQQRLHDIRDLVDFIKCELPNEPLPASLPAVDFCDGKKLRKPLVDPATGAPYVYERTSEDRFKVCATLELSAKDRRQAGIYRSYYLQQAQFDEQTVCMRAHRENEKRRWQHY